MRKNKARARLAQIHLMRFVRICSAWILSILLILVLLVFAGCASLPKTQIVYVPTPCDVPKRIKPAQNANSIKYLKEVLIYAEGLENDLAFCHGELEF